MASIQLRLDNREAGDPIRETFDNSLPNPCTTMIHTATTLPCSHPTQHAKVRGIRHLRGSIGSATRLIRTLVAARGTSEAAATSASTLRSPASTALCGAG